MEDEKKIALVRNLQAEIKTMRDADRDAVSLIEKINKDTANIVENTKADLVKLREQIRKDLAELKIFTDPNIYKTTHIDISDPEDKYGMKEGDIFPVITPVIIFGNDTIHNLQDHWNDSELESVGIKEFCGDTIFRDGVFADEVEGYAIAKKQLDAFYRHWPDILVLAYERLLKVYKDETTYKLEEALKKKTEALKRQAEIKIAMLAALTE